MVSSRRPITLAADSAICSRSVPSPGLVSLEVEFLQGSPWDMSPVQYSGIKESYFQPHTTPLPCRIMVLTGSPTAKKSAVLR